MKREYKNSGVAWVKIIPSDWVVIRGKNLLKLMNRPVRDNDDVVTCFRDGEVILRSERRTEGFTMSDKEIGYQGINKGDIVIHGMDGFAGAMGVSKSTGKGSPVLIVCKPRENDDSRYIVYYLRALALNNVFLALATGIRERSCDLRWNKIAELPFIRPSVNEQYLISNYIDKKCREIDELIALQEKMIEQLTEYKKAVIKEKVTKGLNPYVKLVPSGIEWVGNIPLNWNISPLSLLFVENNKVNANIQSLNALQFKLGNIIRKSVIGRDYDEKDLEILSSYTLVDNNDIVINGLNLNYDFVSLRVALVEERGIITSAYKVISPINSTYSKYYNYLLKAFDFQKVFHGMGVGLRLTLRYNELKKLKLLVPPREEQEAIVEQLDKKSHEIDTLISMKRQKIEALKDYKKSLIYETVTGIKVIQ